MIASPLVGIQWHLQGQPLTDCEGHYNHMLKIVVLEEILMNFSSHVVFAVGLLLVVEPLEGEPFPLWGVS